jgi:hypothetical protein
MIWLPSGAIGLLFHLSLGRRPELSNFKIILCCKFEFIFVLLELLSERISIPL